MRFCVPLESYLAFLLATLLVLSAPIQSYLYAQDASNSKKILDAQESSNSKKALDAKKASNSKKILGTQQALDTQEASNIQAPTPFDSRGARESKAEGIRSYTPGECAAISAVDLLVPGTGRLINKDYAKLSIDALNIYSRLSLSDGRLPSQPLLKYDYRDPSYDRSYLQRQMTYAFSIFNIWDFYESQCAKNPKSAKIFLAPFQFKHFYNKPLFLVIALPLVAAVATEFLYPQWKDSAFVSDVQEFFTPNAAGSEELVLEGTNPYLSIASDTLSRTLAFGIGEELLYRGILQKELYYLFQSPALRFSPKTSRYAAILLSSLVFGLAHIGSSDPAFSTVAGLGGVLFGLAYQPRVGEFDLITPIAMHAWFHILGGLFAWAVTTRFASDLDDSRAATLRTNIPIFQMQHSF